MVSTVTNLSADAKLNLRHEDCWQVFTSIIRPQIEQLLSSYFVNWQRIEQEITAIVMKHKGLFTTRQIITRIGDDDTEVNGLSDVVKFRRIKRMGFRHKICYLLSHELVSDQVLDLVYNLAKRRNRMHEYAEVLTDDDRELFSKGYSLLHFTYIARCFETETNNMNIKWNRTINSLSNYSN